MCFFSLKVLVLTLEVIYWMSKSSQEIFVRNFDRLNFSFQNYAVVLY